MSDSTNSELESLFAQAIKGDTGAQAALLETHRGRLRKMIAIRLDKRLAARADPSDVVQETMHAAHQRLPEYFADPQIPFYPWLRRIAWDRLVDIYRTHVGAEKRSVLREHPWKPDLNDESFADLARSIAASSINPSRQAMFSEMQARIKIALLKLKPDDREILVLRYLEQLDIKEIAGILDISHTAVTSRHLRALQRLRRLLGNELGSFPQ